jgi:peptide/nickel transport system permease protein
MGTYITVRVIQSVFVIILVAIASFAIFRVLPGDATAALSGEGEAISAERRQQIEERLGLNKSVPEQMINWLGAIITSGDFGRSTLTNRSIGPELIQRLQNTLHVGVATMIVGMLIGIPAGVLSAIKPNSLIDRLVTTLSVGGVAIPDYLTGLILILLLVVTWDVLPAAGFVRIWVDPVASIRSLVMPTLVVGWVLSAIVARQTRSSMLEVMRQDYVRTARAKGLRERRVIALHALRNGLLPVVTIVGLLLARVFAGAVIVEQIFNIPGMGRWLVQAALQRDLLIVQAMILVIAIAIVIANLLTDISYGMLDPRIRYG